MEYIVKRADKDSPYVLFEELSALDKLCVGAEGWSAESFRSETEKTDGFVLYIEENGAVAALLCGYHAVGEETLQVLPLIGISPQGTCSASYGTL